MTDSYEKKIMNRTIDHLNNIKYLAEYPEPTEKQLEKMYGYLNYCLDCDKEFTFLEPYSHGFSGNYHKFGCSNIARIFGVVYNFFKKVIIFFII
jgi:hypothetical protein